MSELDVFSATPADADEKFLDACRRAGADPVIFEHPRRGPDGERLATTLAQLGPSDPRNCLVVVSGTHGIEGYSGGGVMTQLMRKRDAISLPADTGVLFVHMINPWGLAWNRRENEDNIDLYRNFLYCEPPFAENPEFDALADALTPSAWSGAVRDEADRTIADFVERHGRKELIRIIRTGQHRHPRSLTYHGNGPTWSKRIVDRIADGWLARCQRIAVLDFHTGYGPPGEGLIMSYDQPGSPGYAWLNDWFGEVHVVGRDPRIPLHSRMPYDIIGDRVPTAEVRVAALEYGTVADQQMDVDLNRESNFYHLRGDPLSPEGRDVQRRFRARYYVETDEWKSRVLARGEEVFLDALAGLSAWAATGR